MLAATIIAGAVEATASHRQGNCTSFSFGKISQSGKLIMVLIKSEKTANMPRLRQADLCAELSSRRKRISAGKVIATVANTIRFPYQILVPPGWARKLAKIKFAREKAFSLSGLSHGNSASTVTQKQALAPRPRASAAANFQIVGNARRQSILSKR